MKTKKGSATHPTKALNDAAQNGKAGDDWVDRGLADTPILAAEPVVTTGVDSTTVPAESKPVGSRPEASNSTPQKRNSVMDRFKNTTESTKSPGAASGAESQKKRRSFFGRIKDKLTK